MGAVDLPDLIYNWMVDYFEHSGHITRHQGKESSFAEINASVVQGSVVGPASFLVEASDLRTPPCEYANEICRRLLFAGRLESHSHANCVLAYYYFNTKPLSFYIFTFLLNPKKQLQNITLENRGRSNVKHKEITLKDKK